MSAGALHSPLAGKRQFAVMAPSIDGQREGDNGVPMPVDRDVLGMECRRPRARIDLGDDRPDSRDGNCTRSRQPMRSVALC